MSYPLPPPDARSPSEKRAAQLVEVRVHTNTDEPSYSVLAFGIVEGPKTFRKWAAEAEGDALRGRLADAFDAHASASLEEHIEGLRAYVQGRIDGLRCERSGPNDCPGNLRLDGQVDELKSLLAFLKEPR